MTRKPYCGNLLWQSGLTLLAPRYYHFHSLAFISKIVLKYTHKLKNSKTQEKLRRMRDFTSRARLSAVVAAGTLVFTFLSAFADFTARSYVQSGLIAQWDGIDNAGTGTHDPSATTWKELKGDLATTATALTFRDGKSAYFNGASSSGTLLSGNFPAALEAISNGTFTAELYFKPLAYKQYAGIFHFGVKNTERYFSLSSDKHASGGTDSVIGAFQYKRSSWEAANCQSGAIASLNECHHVDCMANGDSHTIVLDGKTISTHAAGTLVKYSTTKFQIGKYTESNPLQKMDLFAIRLYSRVLTADEIAWNAAIDKIRFEGAASAEAQGYRYNSETGKIEVRVRVSVTGSGTVAVDGGEAGVFYERWLDTGTAISIVATPDAGMSLISWRGQTPESTETPGVYVFTVNAPAELSAVMGGASRTWVGGTDSLWATGANWEPEGVPQAGERVTIPAGNSVIVSEDMPKLATFDLAGTLMMSNWFTAVRADTVTIAKGGKLTSGDPFAASEPSNRVYVVCRDFTLESGASVNVDDKGYKTSNGPGNPSASGNGKTNGGASYGGHGGLSWRYAQGVLPVVYGSAENPLDPGSGGSNSNADLSKTSRGGGAVLIDATGIVTVNGTITASATYSVFNSSKGMGSGGGIAIRSRRFKGAGGVIRANGVYGQANWDASQAAIDQALPGGGGRISIKYDPAAERDGDFLKMRFSAAAGTFYEKHKNTTSFYRACTLADTYWTDADIGTLWFSDNRPVTGNDGVTLIGQLVHTNRFDFTTLVVTNGHWRFAAEETVVNVAGDMKISGANTRIEFGGSEMATNRLVTVDIRAYRPWTLNVGGDLTVSGGARIDARSAATNGIDEAGSYVNVAGDMKILGNEPAFVAVDGTTVKSGVSSVYAFSDRINGGAPLFTVGSLTVESNALFTASRLGFASGSATVFLEGTKISTGLGPGGGMCNSPGTMYAGGGHGGRGSCTNTLANSGKVYDDPLRPVLAGSGGGGLHTTFGRCFGGGAIRVKASGAIVVDGTVSADGETDAKTYAGAGAGGSILFDCRTFSGNENGLLSACGGSGMGLSNGRVSGGGGGGRIAVWTGKPWEPGVRIRHLTVSDEPIASRKDGSVYLGRTAVDGGVDAYRPESTNYWGMPGTVRFVDYPGIPGFRLFLR